jgi:hypothetical protein
MNEGRKKLWAVEEEQTKKKGKGIFSRTSKKAIQDSDSGKGVKAGSSKPKAKKK